MNKEFIPYEQALALKELGFDEPCFGHYLIKKFYLKKYHKQGNGITLRPLYQQAFKWFRENHMLFYDNLHYVGDVWKFTTYSDNPHHYFNSSEYKTYEEAELECLKKLIEIVKTK